MVSRVALAVLVVSPVALAQGVAATGKIFPVFTPTGCGQGETHFLECTGVFLKSAAVNLDLWVGQTVKVLGPDVGVGCRLLDVQSVAPASVRLSVGGNPVPGGVVTFEVCAPVAAPPHPYVLYLSPAGGYAPVSPLAGTVLVSLPPIPYGSGFAFPCGSSTLPIPSEPLLVGQKVWAQAFAIHAFGELSNAACFGVRLAGTLLSLVENFDGTANLDAARTNAVWDGASPGQPGVLYPGTGRGGGILGDFVASGTVVLDTDLATFPIPGVAPAPLPIAGLVVQDGIFQFSRFEIPAGATVRVAGSRPLRLFVRGETEIDGTLDLSGSGPGGHHGKNTALAPYPDPPYDLGQPGGSGGPGAGRGGDGATVPPDAQTVPPSSALSGRDGEGVGGVGGFANGGGGGSSHYPLGNVSPTADLRAEICPACCDNIIMPQCTSCKSLQRASGGGGGGYATAGLPGFLGFSINAQPPQFGGWASCSFALSLPDSPNGIAGPPVAPIPTLDPEAPGGMLRGGSGGGGAGVHPYETRGLPFNFCSGTFFFCTPNNIPDSNVVWYSGCGGGGGGGAGQIQASTITVGAAGALDARGGRGGFSTDASGNPNAFANNFASGGGGGSGGALLLQASRQNGIALSSGAVGLYGGPGGTTFNPGLETKGHGGPGGWGVFQIEANPTSAPAQFAGAIETPTGYPPVYPPPPPIVTGPFTGLVPAAANFSAAQSRFLDLGPGASSVTFQKYALKVSSCLPSGPCPPANPEDPTQSLHFVYTDDPFFPQEPLFASSPVVVFFQGAEADPTGQPIPGTETAWVPRLRDLNAHGSRLVRFVVLFDHALVQVQQFVAALEVRLFAVGS